MTVVSAWRIAPFNSKVHDRSAFSCGAPELDTYIRRLASQDMRRDVARVFVATGADAEAVVGYYTLSAAHFRREALPADQANGFRTIRFPERCWDASLSIAANRAWGWAVPLDGCD